MTNRNNLIFGLLAAALLVVGCGSDNDKGSKQYTYHDYTTVSPSNWNELTYQDNNDTQVMSYIGSSFFTYDFAFDANGEIIPGAFEIEYSAATKLEDVTAQYAGNEKWGIPAGTKSARAYKITLRNDLKWDDGTEIHAEDFVYTMSEQLNPLFWNYRADSFYTGATVIHNAQNYLKQGSTVDETVSNLYPSFDAAMAAHDNIYLDVAAATSQVNKWFGESGYPLSTFDGAGMLDTYFALYTGEGEDRAPVMEGENVINFFEKYGFLGENPERVKVTAEMIADYNSMDAWDPNADAEMGGLTVIEGYVYPKVDFKDVGIFVGDNKDELVLVLDLPLELLKEDGSLVYKAAYNMSSLPLVKKDLYEKCKQKPQGGSELWTSNYNSSKETTASWGPYSLTEFQAGKSYT